MEIKKCPFCGGIGELTMDEKIKQTIEEMELVMHNSFGCRYFSTKEMKLHNDRFFNREATALYNAGYRKESDTAREILTLIKNGVELNSMIDGDAKIAIMNELRWAGRRYGVDFTNSLEKGGEKNGKTSIRS